MTLTLDEDPPVRESELLGSLLELRGFATETEREVLGDPVRPTSTDDPFQDLYEASGADLEREAELGRLQDLYELRVEVACHSLSSLNDDELQELATRSQISEKELLEARTLARGALSLDPGERAETLSSLLETLLNTSEVEGRGVNDLLGEIRRLGRWPGDPTSDHVVAYRRALGRSVVRNARFAFWIAHKTLQKPSPAHLLTALQGLWEALERFDPHRGAALTTYAAWWVRQRVQRSLADHGADVRVPVHFWELRGRLLRAGTHHAAEHGEFPGLDELVRDPTLANERPKVEKILRFGLVSPRDAWARLCEGSVPDEELLFDANVPTARDELLDGVLVSLLEEAVSSLDERAQTIIRRRFELGSEAATLKEIGRDFDVSRERVRQVQNQALDTLFRRVGGRLQQEIHAVESA